jgi:threonine dehydrogenase-like Zn-dependent dehydrogenase
MTTILFKAPGTDLVQHVDLSKANPVRGGRGEQNEGRRPCRDDHSLAFARSLGFADAWTEARLPTLPFDAVIDASNAAHLPARALELVEPAGRVVYIGLVGQPSYLDTRRLVLKDVTAVGVLSASPGLAATIRAYASREVGTRPPPTGAGAPDQGVPVVVRTT